MYILNYVMSTLKKERTNIYLNSDIKRKAKKILEQYGLSLSDAINIFLTQVVLVKGIPFQIRIPNKETQKVLREVREGKNLEEIDLETLKKEVKGSVKS